MKFYTNVSLNRNNILVRGYDNGERVKKQVPYKPYFFVPSKTKSDYKTLEGSYVERLDFNTIREARDFHKTYKDVKGFRLYGMDKFVYTYIHDNYPDRHYKLGLIRTGIIDIEVASDDGFPDIQTANKEITAISLRFNGKTYVFGRGNYNTDDTKILYHRCGDEYILLETFLECWQRLDLDVITGWNIEFFDLPYLINRIKRILSSAASEKLSPWGILQDKSIEFMGKEQQAYAPVGIAVLDYLQLYKKFAYIRAGQDAFKESMKLDYIAHKELGEKKLDWSEYASLHDLYKQNYQKFIDYNIHDVYLVEQLDRELKFLELVFAVAYDAKVNYNDAFKSVLLWDVIIYNYLMDRNTVIPQYKKTEGRSLVGAFVKHPEPGMYNWVLSFDLTSLYPHILIQYNISPETLIGKTPNFPSVDELLRGEYKTNKNTSVTANGCRYRKDIQGFIPALMELQFKLRSEFRAKGDESAQLAKKIQLNSLYGALANEGFRFYDINNAEAVTLSGQLSIRWAQKKLNKFLNDALGETAARYRDFVIYIDTDSLYVDMSPIVEKAFKDDADVNTIVDFLSNVAKRLIEPALEKGYQELANYMGAPKQAMKMKREVIADKAILQTKKRYILNVRDFEGKRYDVPKLKVLGIEAVRSSTPASCRDNIMKVLNIILNKDEHATREFIAKFKEEFKKLPFEDISFPRGMNGIDKYRNPATIYKLGTPIHVKGALIYNKLLKDKKLKALEPIYNGTKIKFCYLKMPNPTYDTVISTPGFLPSELGLDNYLDREQQFQKAFLDPIKAILDVIGWEIEPKATLEAFL